MEDDLERIRRVIRDPDPAQVKTLGDLFERRAGATDSTSSRPWTGTITNCLTEAGLTGFGGGKLKALAHYILHVGVDGIGGAGPVYPADLHLEIDDLFRRSSGSGAPAAAGLAALRGFPTGRPTARPRADQG